MGKIAKNDRYFYYILILKSTSDNLENFGKIYRQILKHESKRKEAKSRTQKKRQHT